MAKDAPMLFTWRITACSVTASSSEMARLSTVSISEGPGCPAAQGRRRVPARTST